MDEEHGVTFIEAATVLGDAFSKSLLDEEHSSLDEIRYITLGISIKHRLLVVSHCERKGKSRIISARLANKLERCNYEEES